MKLYKAPEPILRDRMNSVSVLPKRRPGEEPDIEERYRTSIEQLQPHTHDGWLISGDTVDNINLESIHAMLGKFIIGLL